ncbi:MAG TPA: MJ0042-type zinc finger domain-containing protein [Thermoguttaceae bacterium]|nr:MJ0042-type zinc finger domain-containing protein [Thermoguttaceae bacterium]
MTKVTTCCPQCRATYEIDRSHIGRRARCKKCGTRFVIPDPESEQQTPAIAEPAAEPAEQPSGSQTGLEARARSVLSYETVDEKRLATDEPYRKSKVEERAEIIAVAKEACEAAGHTDCISHLDTILGLGTILYMAWGKLAPRMEAKNMEVFEYTEILVVACWDTPESVIRRFALREHKPDETDEDLVHLVAVTASSLKQTFEALGLGSLSQ